MQAEAVSHCDLSAVWRKTDGDTEQHHEHHVIAARKLLIELTEQSVDRTSRPRLLAQEELMADPKRLKAHSLSKRPPTLSPSNPSSAH